jgi:hypothetical protein
MEREDREFTDDCLCARSTLRCWPTPSVECPLGFTGVLCGYWRRGGSIGDLNAAASRGQHQRRFDPRRGPPSRAKSTVREGLIGIAHRGSIPRRHRGGTSFARGRARLAQGS